MLVKHVKEATDRNLGHEYALCHDGRHFVEDIFKSCNFLGKICILHSIVLKFFFCKSALVQVIGNGFLNFGAEQTYPGSQMT